jgi:hypothetical protein
MRKGVYMKVCKECLSKARSHKKPTASAVAVIPNKDAAEDPQSYIEFNKCLSELSDNDIIDELIRRGYSGAITKTINFPEA